MEQLGVSAHGGANLYFADWATDTHTHTLWEYTQTHTQKNTKRGSTMINNDQHSPPRATLAPYVSSYLLVSPRISSYLLVSPRISSYLLVSPRTLYGRSV